MKAIHLGLCTVLALAASQAYGSYGASASLAYSSHPVKPVQRATVKVAAKAPARQSPAERRAAAKPEKPGVHAKPARAERVAGRPAKDLPGKALPAKAVAAKAEAKHGLPGKSRPVALTAAERRAEKLAEAREAKRGHAALAGERHPALRETASARQPVRGSRLMIEEHTPAHGIGAHTTSAHSPEPRRIADASVAEAIPAPALPPISVHHDRKQHFAADGTAEPEGSGNDGPEPVIAAPYHPATGYSHPPDFNDEAPARNVPGNPPIQDTATPVKAAPKKTSANVGALAPWGATPMDGGGTLAALPPTMPTVEEEVLQTRVVPPLFNEHGKLMMPPALKGSHEILLHQNVEADREGLTRIQDDDDLARLRAQKALVGLPAVEGLLIDDRLPANRRFARPWTARFLEDLARAHYARFHSELVLTSAVRTVAVQERLLRTNGNAAPANGETASPHLTGQAVDLGKKGLSLTEIAWMRGYLLPLVQAGKADVEEEFQQSCFHISVYRGYLPASPAGRAPSPVRHVSTSTLATAVR